MWKKNMAFETNNNESKISILQNLHYFLKGLSFNDKIIKAYCKKELCIS